MNNKTFNDFLNNGVLNIEEIVNQFDVLGVCGNGASYDVLKEAGADKADLVVATTTNDETNILSCLISEKMLKTKHIFQCFLVTHFYHWLFSISLI